MRSLLAVFWDVDGTIADTELDGHRVAFNRSFKDFNLNWEWDTGTYIQLLNISGGLNRIIYYRNSNQNDLSNEICSKIQLRKRFHYREIVNAGIIKPRNGVLRLIEELASNDVEQYIVTTSSRDSLEPLLKTSLSNHIQYFSGKITYEDVNNLKPFPDAYKLAINQSKKLPANCLAIEDSKNGVYAANAANLNCLLTLPSWYSFSNNIPEAAKACVDTLGNNENKTNVIYGKKLINKYVDFSYLDNIIK